MKLTPEERGAVDQLTPISITPRELIAVLNAVDEVLEARERHGQIERLSLYLLSEVIVGRPFHGSAVDVAIKHMEGVPLDGEVPEAWSKLGPIPGFEKETESEAPE